MTMDPQDFSLDALVAGIVGGSPDGILCSDRQG